MSMSHFILKSLPIVNRKISSISNRRFSTNFPLNVLRRENIPTFALIVGLSALSFQIGVLYPWHEILSEDFQKLQKETVLLQQTARDLGHKMDQVMQLEIEVKAKERKVLEREEEILLDEQKILALSKDVNSKLDVILSLIGGQIEK